VLAFERTLYQHLVSRRIVFNCFDRNASRGNLKCTGCGCLPAVGLSTVAWLCRDAYWDVSWPPHTPTQWANGWFISIYWLNAVLRRGGRPWLGRIAQTGTGSISPVARWHVTREISWIGSVTPRPGKSAGVDFSYKKCKGSPYSITERRVPELIPVLGSQPAGDVSHKPGGELPLLSARPAVTPATLKEAATNFAAWWTEAQWVWTVCLRLLPDSVATAIWTRALLRLSPAR